MRCTTSNVIVNHMVEQRVIGHIGKNTGASRMPQRGAEARERFTQGYHFS